MISILQADVIAGNGPDIARIIFVDFSYVAENFGVPALEDIGPAEELAGHFAGLFPMRLKLGRLDGNSGLFLITGPVQAALLKGAGGKFDLRSVRMPTFGDKQATPTNSGSDLMVLTQDHQVRQRVAWDLMQHLTADYGSKIITSKIGHVPLRRTTVASKAFSTLVIAASLSNISPALIEAARMDGGTEWQITRRIRLPPLSPR